jgi:hypothetical protein
MNAREYVQTMLSVMHATSLRRVRQILVSVTGETFSLIATVPTVAVVPQLSSKLRPRQENHRMAGNARRTGKLTQHTVGGDGQKA